MPNVTQCCQVVPPTQGEGSLYCCSVANIHHTHNPSPTIMCAYTVTVTLLAALVLSTTFAADWSCFSYWVLIFYYFPILARSANYILNF